MSTMEEPPAGLSFFGLAEQPFAATADPAYLYATRTHKECLFRVWSSIEERHGIVVVLGNYGSGKTTLLRKIMAAMRQDPTKYNTAVIGSPIPSWTSFALLEAIVNQFGLRPAQRSFMEYMEALNRYLLANRNHVNTLIIDDAQNLNKRGQLELLRLAQNLETQQHKLLNLVFFAQMEWMQVLEAAPNFAQRINMTYQLSNLDEQDTWLLIDYRVKQAGASGIDEIFDPKAVQLIHEYAEGSPRVTVTICRNSLVVAERLHIKPVSPEIVVHTIEKTMLPDPKKRAKLATYMTSQPATVAPVAWRPASAPQAMEFSERAQHMSNEQRANEMLLKAMRGRDNSMTQPESR
jgi:general secretion pathway protein A